MPKTTNPKPRKPAVRGEAVVSVNLMHWSSTVVCYDSNMYGYPLMHLLPDVPLGHGTKIKVTVELIESGKPCALRNHGDGNKCAKRKESK